MITALFTGIASAPWIRATLRYGTIGKRNRVTLCGEA